MIARSHELPLMRQARELGMSRGSIYYLPKPVSPADLAEDNELLLDAYRFDALDFFYEIAAPVKVAEAA